MAEAAKQNAISKETLEAFLDRYEGFEDDAATIMGEAMSACKNGPRKSQKELRAEMKEAGIRKKTFNAMWAARDAARKASTKIAELEDDDLDQLRECATALKDTPFGEWLQARMDEPSFT
ncbi:MAG: hypothetical protein WA418_38710 [Bradyrhizobium sp.]